MEDYYMFMELVNKDYKRTINTDYIITIFPEGDRTGIKLIDYKAIVYTDMSYSEFMKQFRTINMLNALMED